MLQGKQLIVDDTGSINNLPISPSVAVSDLNGDGLPDLVVADAVGFFWYFQNTGTKTNPAFASAQVMPIWLGDPCTDLFNQDGLVTNNVVPRIQLVDLNGQGKLDLIAGTYQGKLFYFPNRGTTSSPVFKMSPEMNEDVIATHSHGVLWCNYLAPLFYDWRHTGIKDLIVGDGSYSANSIYLLKNKGTNDRPSFDDDSIYKIIPGMGREQLVPQAVSWNGDGKADILTTEREGYVNIYLNQTKGLEAEVPAFDQGHHVLIGGEEKLNQRPTVTMADLTGTGLPGLIIATADGRISFSKNIGTGKKFQFAAPYPLKLACSTSTILRPYGWDLDGGYGSPYDLLVCTNPQVEAGFTLPDDSGVKTALRFYRDQPGVANQTFPSGFYPKLDTRLISREGVFNLKGDTRYKLSFWIKTDGDISNLKYIISGLQPDPNAPDSSIGRVTVSDSVNASGVWDHFTTTVRFRSLSDDTKATIPFSFQLVFNGSGSLYIANLELDSD